MVSMLHSAEYGSPPLAQWLVATAAADLTRRLGGAKMEQAMSNGVTASPRPMPAVNNSASDQTEGHRTQNPQSAVHPKWLTIAACEVDPAPDREDAARFTAFRQLL